jgi:hypothetical protein
MVERRGVLWVVGEGGILLANLLVINRFIRSVFLDIQLRAANRRGFSTYQCWEGRGSSCGIAHSCGFIRSTGRTGELGARQTRRGNVVVVCFLPTLFLAVTSRSLDRRTSPHGSSPASIQEKDRISLNNQVSPPSLSLANADLSSLT